MSTDINIIYVFVLSSYLFLWVYYTAGCREHVLIPHGRKLTRSPHFPLSLIQCVHAVTAGMFRLPHVQCIDLIKRIENYRW